ncbi:MAG: bifunctional [glutamine synthetase] adenylyltransferase/[glutamine synthetase]-adenylyl-L-tyrosine phosphorylase, partial [Pseudomonadota bacterium]
VAATARRSGSAAATLRRAKGRAALLIGLADLGGVWPLEAVTGALSALAETATEMGVATLYAAERARGRMPALLAQGGGGHAGDAGGDAGADAGGYVVLGMGKLGAHELNYSSDIDLICLFDQDRYAPEDYAEAKAGYVRITRGLVQLLSEATDDGYVFRTDLRLRPAPSSTSVCVAMEAAERYYEAEGRTWERAAHIKARAVAGDLAAGAAYLDRLAPFVWRRSLDFYAIEEVQGLLRQIRSQAGHFDLARLPGRDIKRAPGGIREIEFFVQTRQLVMGGRNPGLRARGTCEGLAALAGAGVIAGETAARLTEDYRALRSLEHRLQMLEDARTHALPASEAARERLAAFCGAGDRAGFERDLVALLARVHETVSPFFEAPNGVHAAATPAGGPADEAALEAAGFARPADAARLLRGWRQGGIAATRSERAQTLFERLEPALLAGLARASSPDDAIAAFDRFLTRLPAGVQVFSLFAANPHLLDLIIGIMAASPRLAAHLGAEPEALEALLARDFFDPMPDAAALRADLEAAIAARAGVVDYERALDAVRRWAREARFRAGVQVLRGMADEAEAGAAFSAVAEACLGALLPRVVADFARRHGAPPGHGMAVIALGKLGSREMTAGSDLDLITVYDPGGAERSEGPRPLPPTIYYPRLTKALLAALTAPTAEGRLYEVDMRLRPSGRQGPVAVSLEGFRRYHAEEAWVWEHMALTRARVVVSAPGERDGDGEGDADADAGPLADRVDAAIREALARRVGDPRVGAEAAEMRRRLIAAHAGERAEPWALKHAAGGLMEIEFLGQTGALICGLAPGAPAAGRLAALAAAGWIAEGEGAVLAKALALQSRLQQLERAALDSPTRAQALGESLCRALAAAGGAPDFATLSQQLTTAQAGAAAAVAARFEALEAEAAGG